MQLYENMGCIHLGSTGIGWEKCWERLKEFFPDTAFAKSSCRRQTD